MEVISLILSGLALLVAAVNLFLFIREKKREDGRRKTLKEHINAEEERVQGIEKRLSDLEKGISPDYNAALAVKESVDRFSEGIMNILTYGNPAPPQEKQEKDKEDKE